jgi:hypothetical protein
MWPTFHERSKLKLKKMRLLASLFFRLSVRM